MMDFKIISFVLFSLVGNSLGQLRCYTCGFSSVDTDRSCLTITNSTLSSDCPYQYCTILRQEFVDPPGVIASFTRGCDDFPDFLNHEVLDPTFRTIYRARSNDLCNIGQLRCYTCGFSSVDTDRSCLTITNSTLSSDCPYQYCTILRQEFVDPPGVIASFTRGCDDSPDFLNHEVIDPTFRTIYRACSNDLCNIGDGIQSVVGGSLSPTPEYTGLNLLVPGTATGGASATANAFVLLILTAVIGIW